MTERIVLDTNCLVQIISRQAYYGFVWDEIIHGNVVLCVTTEILYEYDEILTRFFGEKVAKSIVDIILLLPKTERYDVFYHWTLIKEDADDNKFVDCAVVSNAKYLVSNDNHFNILKQITFPKIDVLRLEDFANKLKG